MTNTYLQRYAYPHQQLDTQPDTRCELIVVIPCYNEWGIIACLSSLAQSAAPQCTAEVIVVVNQSIDAPVEVHNRNTDSIKEIKKWITLNNKKWLNFEVIECLDLPSKHAGVGLARKIGMDEAVRRFESIQKEGIIVCFDADSKCEPNYFQAIEDHFQCNPKSPACSIYYEHPISGDESPEIYTAIINYELHLRYYVWAQRYSGHPFAFQTIGSSMAVRSGAYQQQGGMNRRKAGEDFYFLHKLIPLGYFTELTATKVIPSPRKSDRVPFGTGKAVTDFLAKKESTYHSYALKSFLDLKLFFDLIPLFYEIPNSLDAQLSSLPPPIRDFLAQVDAIKQIEVTLRHSTTPQTFKNRFFRWFDGFMVMKYVHYARDHYYANEPISSLCERLLRLLDQQVDGMHCDQLLKQFRQLDRYSKFAG